MKIYRDPVRGDTVGDAGNKYSEITHALIGEIYMDKSKAVP